MTHTLAGSGNRFTATKDRLSATGLKVVLFFVYRHCRQYFPRVPPPPIYHNILSHQGWGPSK